MTSVNHRVQIDKQEDRRAKLLEEAIASEVAIADRKEAFNLIAQRWADNRQIKDRQYTCAFWRGRLRVVGQPSNSKRLRLMVRAYCPTWETAGIIELGEEEDGWKYIPANSTELARRTLTSIIQEYLSININLS